MQSITIKADELAAFAASNPRLGLCRGTDLTFDLNEYGEVVDCRGEVSCDRPANIDRCVQALKNIILRRHVKQLRNLDRKPEGSAVILPFKRI